MHDPQAQNKKIVIVVSEFNKTIIERLLQGAVSALYHFGGTNENLIIYRVPGAFEIPGTISQVLKHDRPDAIIALGAVIRGETPHFDIIAAESANGLSELSRNNDIPIINGIITTDNREQALKRSQIIGSNKGWDAMDAAFKVISIYRNIQNNS
tara:strand:+ start:739 stop:1200 length:462 start_codon:yes stop_codon:yes gene_type:complete